MGPSDYIETCDDIDQVPCVGACEFGGTMIIPGGHAPGILNFIDGQVTSTGNALAGFTGQAFSINFWIKTTDNSASAVIFNFATSTLTQNTITVMNPSSLSIIIGRGKLLGANNKGFRSGVNVADGLWHHIVLTWRSYDGRLVIYKDGLENFNGGPYRTRYVIPNVGSLSIGRGLQGPCTPLCNFEPQTKFTGTIQHLKMWNKVLTDDEALATMQIPFVATINGLVLSWRFDGGVNSAVTDTSVNGNTGVVGSSGVTYSPGWPTVRPLVNCGSVYGHRWYFAAPSKFIGNIFPFKGGRLQFKLKTSSHTGLYRNPRNSIVLHGSNGIRLLYNAIGILDQDDQWRSYSIPLIWNVDWTYEDYNPVSQTNFDNVLKSVTKLLILGDIFTYDSDGSISNPNHGYGTEIVYLNDVSLVYSNGLATPP